MGKSTFILILAAIFLSCFSGAAQNNSETLTIVKKGLETEYYQGGRLLNLNQLMEVIKGNSVAYTFIKQADDLNNTSTFFYIIGSGALGFSVGYAIGQAIVGNLVNLKVLIPTLGAGSAFIACGITCKITSNNKIQKGIWVYNNSLLQKTATNVDLSISPTGFSLKLSF